MTVYLRHDFETRSEEQLVGKSSVGLYNYASDISTQALMLAYRWGEEGKPETGPIHHIDFTKGDKLPPDVRDAVMDPHVLKKAFNAGFERSIFRLCLGIKTPIKGWRCTMAHAYMQSFTGGLGEVGDQLGIPPHLTKNPIGKKLIQRFSVPQRVTKNQPHRWRDRHTDPDEWEEFCGYNVQDVEAEAAIDAKLTFPVLDKEWQLYELDQRINDRGLPVNMAFVDHAAEMAARRKDALTVQLRDLTGLSNPNSPSQLLDWLRGQGYQHYDLQKLTIVKALALQEEEEDFLNHMTPLCVQVLKLRQQVSRTSVKKYDAIQLRIDRASNRLRHCFQYGGASRTLRWAGRGPQPHNLVRTPKNLEDWDKLIAATEAIQTGDYELLDVIVKEPMDALAGLVRSAFQALKEDEELVVCDLTAIESAVIAWLSDCKRLLKVFNDGLDPYRDFGTTLYKIVYEAITGEQRGICKPAVLGCGFGLGGGRMVDGKKTGLWAYAENMGVKITQKEAARQVKAFRDAYPEIVEFWAECERAARLAVDRRETVSICGGKLTFALRGDYLTVELPSGRVMFYHKPEMKHIEFNIEKEDPLTGEKFIEKFTRYQLTHMGSSQITGKWQRVVSGGPKLVENFVQATAREILGAGKLRSNRYGFNIVGSVHDEQITLQKKGDNRFSPGALEECMTFKEFWMEGLPLKAKGFATTVYRKD